MGKPTPKERVEHILEAIRLIKEFVSGMNEKTFSRDVKVQSAVQYQFLIIGEAAGTISPQLLQRYEFPWFLPKSFRNFIIHEYIWKK